MIKLLIFDFDGTIADSAHGICASVNEFLEKHNKPTMSLESIKPHIGLGLSQLLTGIFPGEGLSFLDQKPLYDDFIKCYENHFSQNMTTFPGFNNFLNSWEYKIAIVSNKWERFLNPSLKKLQLEQHNWVHVFGRDSLPEHKPHPLPLETCLKTAQLKPYEALMIGDGLPDMNAARAANIKSVAVEFGYGPIKALKQAGANYTLKHFDDLHKLIEVINSSAISGP